MSEIKKKRADWQSAVVTKVWQNPDFKKQLLTNPSAVLSQETGIEIPKGITIHILEEDSENMYFVLPKDPATVQALSESQLDQVAGGSWSDDRCANDSPTPCSSCIGTW